jgi:hypothetical protein
MHYIILTKNGVGYTLGDFFSQTHPVTLLHGGEKVAGASDMEVTADDGSVQTMSIFFHWVETMEILKDGGVSRLASEHKNLTLTKLGG